MKNLLVLLMVVAGGTFGCDRFRPLPAGPSPITIVNSNQNTNNSGSGSDVALPPIVSNNIVLLDPLSIQVEVDRRAAVSVTVSTPGGVTVAVGGITTTILDPSIVMFSEVIGERLFLRGVNVGETTVIVHAGGATAQLNVTVVPKP